MNSMGSSIKLQNRGFCMQANSPDLALTFAFSTEYSILNQKIYVNSVNLMKFQKGQET